MICKDVFTGTTEMASHIPNILRALSRACTRATRGFQKFREGSMHKRKRSRMAFRPCLSQAFLEDRLVLNSGAVGVSSPIQAIATHAAMIRAAAIPAALVSPSTASSAVSSAKQAPVAASPSQSSLAISNSNQYWLDWYRLDQHSAPARPALSRLTLVSPRPSLGPRRRCQRLSTTRFRTAQAMSRICTTSLRP